MQTSCKVANQLQELERVKERGKYKMFSIKQVANSLQLTTQAIYKQIPVLLKEGKAYRENNKTYITQEGFNELKDKRVATIDTTKLQTKQEKLQAVVQPVANQLQELEPVNRELFDSIKQQLKDMQEQRDYFKGLYELKDKAFNDIVNQKLLSGTEEEQKKSSFWNKIFKR